MRPGYATRRKVSSPAEKSAGQVLQRPLRHRVVAVGGCQGEGVQILGTVEQQLIAQHLLHRDGQ